MEHAPLPTTPPSGTNWSIDWDPHVHAAPSSSDRWGDDLDLVDAAAARGTAGFVLKSHHEPTAGRARIACAYARRRNADVRVLGSVTLNPWISRVELQRALALGARVVWWPTRSRHGASGGLDLPPLPLHAAALDLVAREAGVVVATGHLALAPALELIEQARDRGVTAIATHPLNADVGVGRGALRDVVAAGAVIELDAYGLRTLPPGERADAVRELSELGARVIVASDGGQRANGDPFAFLARTLDELVEHGADPALLATWLQNTGTLMRQVAGDGR